MPDDPVFYWARRLIGIRDSDLAPDVDYAIRTEIKDAKAINRRVELWRIKDMLGLSQPT